MRRLFNNTRIVLVGIVLIASNLLANAQGNYDSRYGNNGYNNNYNNYNGYNNGYDNYNGYNNNGYGATYQDFYDGLAPYGQWIYDQQYGYVWLPNVGPDFRPYYTNGYWAMTQYGNTWVSNYAWGWATFHYGRWTFDNYYGWLWIPGTEWAPAWVSWRSNNNYYGWAPMGPGINVNFNLNLIPMDWWVFLSPRYFYQPNFHSYCYNNWANTRNIYYQTSYLHHAYGHHHSSYYTGPRADDYYRSTGHRVSMYDINNNTRVGPTTVRGNRIDMYRPNIMNNNNNTTNQPSRFARIDRSISNTPQNYGDGMQQAVGRQQILNQPNWNNGNRNNNAEPRNGWNGQNDMQQRQENQQQMQMQQQRDQQMQMQQQREQQMNQQRMQQQQMQMQQQRDQQMQMQREQQMNQQRMQEQQMQMQQQRDQQRMQQQMQMQQQRDQQMQRPQPSEQRQNQDESFRSRGRF